jgi:hypothetical protein
VPIVVTMHDKPVTGLQKNAFSISENGKQRKVGIFEEVKSESAFLKALSKPATAAREFSNLQMAIPRLSAWSSSRWT